MLYNLSTMPFYALGKFGGKLSGSYNNIVKQRDCDQKSHVRLVQIPDVEGLPCDMWGLYFSNERALRTHMEHMHPKVKNVASKLIKNIPRYNLGVDGMLSY